MTTENNVNSYMQEYRKKNKDIINKYMREYYNKNTEVCTCGETVKKQHLKLHKKSNKHYGKLYLKEKESAHKDTLKY